MLGQSTRLPFLCSRCGSLYHRADLLVECLARHVRRDARREAAVTDPTGLYATVRRLFGDDVLDVSEPTTPDTLSPDSDLAHRLRCAEMQRRDPEGCEAAWREHFGVLTEQLGPEPCSGCEAERAGRDMLVVHDIDCPRAEMFV